MKHNWNPHSPIFEDEECVGGVDWRGNEFRIGDLVMYCIGAGRGQMMAVGKIQKIRFRWSEWEDYEEVEKGEPYDRYRKPWVACDGTLYPESFFRKITTPCPIFEIQVLTEGTSGRWDNEKRTRPAWVNPMNITAIGRYCQ